MPTPEGSILRSVQQGAVQAPVFEPRSDTPDKIVTLDEALGQKWTMAAKSGSYETTSTALRELRELRTWRAAADASRFPEFYQLIEQISQLEKSGLGREERTVLWEELLSKLAAKVHRQSPRIADIYLALLAEIDGMSYTPKFDITAEKVKSLRESGDLGILTSPYASFEVKLNRLKTRLEGELLGRQTLDSLDKLSQTKEEKREISERPSTPPPAWDESKPGMDEMERSPEGESAPAIWTIDPAWGGYYKEQSFDTWDDTRITWRQPTYTYREVTDFGQSQGGEMVQMRAEVVPGQWTRAAVPYTHALVGLTASNGKVHVRQDQNGDYTFLVESGASALIGVILTLEGRKEAKTLTQDGEPTAPSFTTNLSSETCSRLDEIVRRKTGNLPRARAIARLVMQHLTYSNDSSCNALYESHPSGYIAAIDEHRKADCDVANTYFAALCARLNIPVRQIVGHMVKGKDREGRARITSGTGHAWSEVWDDVSRRWVRVDATPPGDPQMDEEEKPKGGGIPGDYGSREEIGPSDKQLQELEEKLANLTEQLQYSEEERQLARSAGIELKEARDIIKEIAQAENTRLPGGERVVDVLSRLFSLIIESRRTTASTYAGPLRKREGGERIDDIVAHKIGILAGDPDPVSRQKEIDTTQTEQVFGGFDLYFIGDKSGSMGDTVNGEEKWRLQRRAQYLILSSLYRFEQNLKAASVQMADPLSVRTQAISFRGSADDDIDLDKPLSNTFSSEDKVHLWRSLGNQGRGNGDVAALSYVHQQISKEIAAVVDQGKTDNRLRIVIPCSDGYPDDVAGVHSYAEALGKQNAVVVGIGLTETAAQVPVIFNTPHSRGDIARDINNLPAIIGRHVVQEAVKLFPERARVQLAPFIEVIVRKFDSLG
ncbi:hypothetical protein KGQ71_03870 [Patescibacteria group bacterium]|nr:hypothetical protein [Patescibacteria group bacterium]